MDKKNLQSSPEKRRAAINKQNARNESKLRRLSIAESTSFSAYEVIDDLGSDPDDNSLRSVADLPLDSDTSSEGDLLDKEDPLVTINEAGPSTSQQPSCSRSESQEFSSNFEIVNTVPKVLSIQSISELVLKTESDLSEAEDEEPELKEEFVEGVVDVSRRHASISIADIVNNVVPAKQLYQSFMNDNSPDANHEIMNELLNLSNIQKLLEEQLLRPDEVDDYERITRYFADMTNENVEADLFEARVNFIRNNLIRHLMDNREKWLNARRDIENVYRDLRNSGIFTQKMLDTIEFMNVKRKAI